MSIIEQIEQIRHRAAALALQIDDPYLRNEVQKIEQMLYELLHPALPVAER